MASNFGPVLCSLFLMLGMKENCRKDILLPIRWKIINITQKILIFFSSSHFSKHKHFSNLPWPCTWNSHVIWISAWKNPVSEESVNEKMFLGDTGGWWGQLLIAVRAQALAHDLMVIKLFRRNRFNFQYSSDQSRSAPHRSRSQLTRSRVSLSL